MFSLLLRGFFISSFFFKIKVSALLLLPEADLVVKTATRWRVNNPQKDVPVIIIYTPSQ